MKKIIISLSLILASVAATMAQTTNEFKLGYVNMEYAFLKLKQTPAMKQAESELQTFIAQKEMALKQLQTKIEGLYNQYQQATTEAEKQGIGAEVQGLENRYRIMQQSVQQEAAQKEQALMQPTIDKINAAIKKVGETEGYTYILTDGLGGNSIVLYAKNEGDNLTKKVLAELGIILPEDATK